MLTIRAAKLHLWSAVYQDASVERCISRCYYYKYTCKITMENNDWFAIALMILHHHVKVNYSKSIYRTSCAANNLTRKMVNCEKGYLQNTTLD